MELCCAWSVNAATQPYQFSHVVFQHSALEASSLCLGGFLSILIDKLLESTIIYIIAICDIRMVRLER